MSNLGIETKDDHYIIFKCGHKALNPKTSTRGEGKYICPVCKRQRGIERSFVQCQGEGCTSIIERIGPSKIRFCEECRKEKARQISIKNNKARKIPSHEHLEPACTLDQIATEFGKTKEWARQEVAKAILKFRDRYQYWYGDPPDLIDPEIKVWTINNQQLDENEEA